MPDAATNGKELALLLLLPEEDIPQRTLEMLQEYHEICTERGFVLPLTGSTSLP